MSASDCCLKGFEWDGTPTGRVGKLGNNDVYIAGDNSDVAVMLIHDLFGWTFPNLRILADHYAREANVTVYLPDFFGGAILSFENIIAGRFDLIDIPNFMKENGREIREPEIFECARALRLSYKKVGAIGFCYGGWAVFRLGAKEHQPRLVDCISMGHPTWLTKKDIDEVAVPLQVLAPETDRMYSPELKLHTFETIQKLGLPLDYHHFPGVEHGCLVRGDARHQGEREAMTRAKNAAVGWFKQCLFDSEA
ncbi:dienelactone hydrolase [Histoplasma capsulatum var. duboisii H88]|uniref:Dienelactone hydrolase n=2 Tax=Ajellomyces capsulatus TaxID=5037 RepID=F0UUE0_AJEC8|nr:dienelactone hydrolase [Histoplasma capsulatum H143]EGC49517.1 dienelactone hydrolase [Histoplasma capsulatum var. duboisii H88]QSS57648.1 dienelactone hydrolase [Histoplasma capsulatum var. duboisii H88]